MRQPKGGIFWSTISGGGAVLLPFGIFVVFARLMSPEALGSIAFGIAILELLKALAPQGLYEVLLRPPGQTRDMHRAAGGLLLMSGCLLSLVFLLLVFGLAGYVPGLQIDPALIALLLPKLMLDLLVLQPQSVLARRLDYRRMAMRTIIANVIAGGGGVLLAWKADPVFGLIAYYVGQSAVILLATVLGTGTWLPPSWKLAPLRQVAREAFWASTVRAVAAANGYLDQFALAMIVPAAALANFNIGRRVERSFTTVAVAFNQIMIQPGFAVSDRAGQQKHFQRALAAITLVCGVPTVALLLTHEAVVPAVFGQQYAGAAPVVALLAAGAFFRALGSVHGSLLSVTGRNGGLSALATLSAVGGLAAVVLAAPFGLTYAAAALALKNLVFLVPMAIYGKPEGGGLLRAYSLTCFLPLGLAAGLAYASAQGLMASLAAPEAALPSIGIAVVATLAGGSIVFPLVRRYL